MVLLQNWSFFLLFFLNNIGQKNVFYDILERKKEKKSKNRHFCKAVDLWFWSKSGYFSNFFLGNIGHKNVFFSILERKNAFLGNKNKKLKKSKN